MTTPKSPRKTSLGLTHEQVREYLLAHPNFFTCPDTLDMLAGLHVPHKKFGMISLLEYQVHMYRQSNEELVEQIKHLVMVHEINERALEGFVAVLNALYAAPNFETLIQGVTQWWRASFDDIDEVKLVLPSNSLTTQIAEASCNVALYSAKRPPKEIDDVVRSKQHQFGTNMSNELASLFVNTKLQSFLLLSDVKKERGALLLGSTSAKRFAQQLNADFASAVAQATIGRIWDLFSGEGAMNVSGGTRSINQSPAGRTSKTKKPTSAPRSVTAKTKKADKKKEEGS